MSRTSATDPLRIAAIRPFETAGRIGVTFCPGKKDARSLSGPWDRDLGVDLDAVAAWGASAVVTLVEDHEFGLLGVDGLGAGVAARHMDWLHLPIADVSVPDARFEAAWAVAGEGLRARLRDGFDVVVHCRGGLGRAGTVAARLLVELGTAAHEAVAAVRQVREGAVETREQEQHVLGRVLLPEARPARSEAASRDRAVGALLGLAVGDAVGTTLEFSRRDDRAARLTDMVGGGPFGLAPGQWTDDTAMALALADSLAADGALDERDLMDRFVSWYREGRYSCTGRCFDIGNTTAEALRRYERTGDPFAGSTDPRSAGNGSLMRLSPVAIRHRRDAERRRDVAARQSRTTHAAAEAVEACVLYADILADAIAGEPRSAVMRPREVQRPGRVAEIAAGAWRGAARSEIRGGGYVVDALKAALWCVGRTADFRSAVLMAANLREDADTTAAIAGQLAGALYGASGIPEAWRRKVAWADRIAALATRLDAAA